MRCSQNWSVVIFKAIFSDRWGKINWNLSINKIGISLPQICQHFCVFYFIKLHYVINIILTCSFGQYSHQSLKNPYLSNIGLFWLHDLVFDVVDIVLLKNISPKYLHPIYLLIIFKNISCTSLNLLCNNNLLCWQ